MITRRDLLIALGAAAVAPSALAQQAAKVWRVGFLAHRHVEFVDSDFYYGPFRQGMRELGYVEGKNLVIEWRSAEGQSDRLPVVAAELVKLNVDVIVVASTPTVSAIKKLTSTIPIVMGGVIDPVGSGFVKSLAHPGGNITGLSNLGGDLGPKLLESLFNILPKLARVAVLVNPLNVGHAILLKNLHAAVPRKDLQILKVEAQSVREIESGFSKMKQERVEAVIVGRDAFFIQHAREIVSLAAKARLPSVFSNREYVEAGGLMSYGSSTAGIYRRAATYVDKILKGAKPADLPVEQPTTFELLVNMKTAKALGIKIPQSILLQATKVIE